MHNKSRHISSYIAHMVCKMQQKAKSLNLSILSIWSITALSPPPSYLKGLFPKNCFDICKKNFSFPPTPLTLLSSQYAHKQQCNTYIHTHTHTHTQSTLMKYQTSNVPHSKITDTPYQSQP